MFKITEGNFKKQKYGNESYLSNWPMLYILENGKQAYIGQSNHVKNRMSQHYNSVDKRIFNKVHFIYSSKFNQSVTFDYESKLIQYIAADELYEVRNKNAGMADKEYYGKVHFTPEGLRYANRLYTDYLLLFEYFDGKLSLQEQNARRDAVTCLCDLSEEGRQSIISLVLSQQTANKSE